MTSYSPALTLYSLATHQERQIMNANVEGKTVKVGDYVCFKSDVEQSGKIIRIEAGRAYGRTLTLENLNGFHGDYIGGQTVTTVQAADCWVE